MSHATLLIKKYWVLYLLCFHTLFSKVKAKQETELELKSFAPPYVSTDWLVRYIFRKFTLHIFFVLSDGYTVYFQALHPELYLLPGVEYFEDVYSLPSLTQHKHHIIEEANRFGHGSRLSSLSQQKPEKNKPFLESIQSRHQVENLEVPSPVEWSEKESVPVSHTNNKQDSNNRIPEKQFGEKGKLNQCSEGGWWMRRKINITINIYNKLISLFHIINCYADQSGSDGSLFMPSHSNPADQESAKCGLVSQSSEKNHLSQDQEECSAPKWNDKAKGTALTRVNHSDEQGQGNQRLQNHIKYQMSTNVCYCLFVKARALESRQSKAKF